MRLFPAALAGGLVTAVLSVAPALAAAGPTTVAVDGTVRVAVLDLPGAPRGTSQEIHAIVTDDGTAIPVDLGDAAPANARFSGELVVPGAIATALDRRDLLPRAGATIAEESRAGRAAIALAAETATPLEVAASTLTPVADAAPAEPGDHHAYVAVMHGVGSVEESDDEIAASLRDAMDYWTTESDGAITSFGIEDTASFTTATDASVDNSCGMMDPFDVWWEAGLLFSDEPEVMFGAQSRNHLVVVMADECSYGQRAGVALLGNGLSSGGPMSIALGTAVTQEAVHELGHTFSLMHANLDTCDQPALCGAGEYHDFFSPMGGGFWSDPDDTWFTAPALDSAFRYRLGLASDAEVPVVASSGATVTKSFDLKARSSSAGVRGLRVVDPVSGQQYFVDYRSGTHRDTGSFYARYSGWIYDLEGGGTYTMAYRRGITISTLTPAGEVVLSSRRSADGFEGSLGEGETFTSPTGAVTIAVGVLASGWGSDVAVTVTPPPAAVPGPGPAAPAFRATAPRITGTARVGRTLRAEVGSWSPRPSFSYQWYANGKKIARKATGRSFTVTSRQKGKRITVRITARKPGYPTTSKSSRPTSKVARR